MNKIALPDAVKQDLIQSIRDFFANERDEELSEFQASLVLDFVLETCGPPIYNQAIADAHAFMSGQLEDVYGLEKRPR